IFENYKLHGHVRGVGARFAIYFGVENPENDFDFRKVAKYFNSKLHEDFIVKSLYKGLFFHNSTTSNFPAHYGFTSQHNTNDINNTLNKMDNIFSKLLVCSRYCKTDFYKVLKKS